MVLSKRERYALIAALGVLGLLLLDRVVLSRLMDARSSLQARHDRLATELAAAESLLAAQKQLVPRWQEMVKTGMKNDAAEAEGQMLHVLRDAAEESGVTLTLLKPERLSEKPRLSEISFQASGSGLLRGVVRLLWRLQTAGVPVKVTELQIVSRKPGVDDLTFLMHVSTVYSRPEASGPAAPGQAHAGGS